MPISQFLRQSAPLDPKDETAFRMWELTNNIPQSNDYDMRGFYAALLRGEPDAASAVNPNDGRMHFPDKWKLPNHATFSTDSQNYNPVGMPNTPTWRGGDLPNGGASWALRTPAGSLVAAEAPWYAGGVKRGLLGPEK